MLLEGKPILTFTQNKYITLKESCFIYNDCIIGGSKQFVVPLLILLSNIRVKFPKLLAKFELKNATFFFLFFLPHFLPTHPSNSLFLFNKFVCIMEIYLPHHPLLSLHHQIIVESRPDQSCNYVNHNSQSV